MRNKLLVICGPTATGKTNLAIRLAKKINGEIVSADSRQVYRGLNIGTGKDLPKGAVLHFLWFKKFGYYQISGIKVWGYDLADPRHSFNISQYLRFSQRIISDIIKRGKTPIIVGGTGLYIKGIIDGIPTADIPKNNLLRKSLENMSVEDLFDSLAKLDPIKSASMNFSDRKNPRRLIRAIEVATWKITSGEEIEETKKEMYDVFQIGLMAPEKTLIDKVRKRVSERYKNKIKDEIASLLKNHVDWNMQSMSSMGYGEWREFFEGRKSEIDVIKTWEMEERRYVKRQIIWFKKDKRIKWFSINSPNYPENVEKNVLMWHNSACNEEN